MNSIFGSLLGKKKNEALDEIKEEKDLDPNEIEIKEKKPQINFNDIDDDLGEYPFFSNNKQVLMKASIIR